MPNIRHFRELEVYQMAMQVAMKIFEVTKSFQQKKDIPSLTKSAVPPDQFVQTLRKLGASAVILTLF